MDWGTARTNHPGGFGTDECPPADLRGTVAGPRLRERDPTGIEEYFEIVTRKTATLYATAASLPAVLIGYEEAVDPLARHGRNVWRTARIQDDLLGLTTPSEQLGKQRGIDLVECKATLVTVHARELGVDADELVTAGSGTVLDESTVDDAVAELDAAGSLEYARQTARDLVENGKTHLAALPDTGSRHLFEAVADYLLEREH